MKIKIKVTLLLFFILFLTKNSFSTSVNEWFKVSAIYEIETLNDIIAFDRYIVTVGDFGIIKRSTDNGAKWSMVQGNYKLNNLNGIAKFNNKLIAVGDRGNMLQSHDNGLNWEEIQTGFDFDFHGIVARKNYSVIFSDNNNIIYSQDYGKSWQKLEFENNSNYYDACFVNDSIIYIVGNQSRYLEINFSDFSVVEHSLNLEIDFLSLDIFNNKIVIGCDNSTIIQTDNLFDTYIVIETYDNIKDIVAIEFLNDSVFVGCFKNIFGQYQHFFAKENFKKINPYFLSYERKFNYFFLNDSLGYGISINGSIIELKFEENIIRFDKYLLKSDYKKYSNRFFDAINNELFLNYKSDGRFYLANNSLDFEVLDFFKDASGDIELYSTGFINKEALYILYDSTYYYQIEGNQCDTNFTKFVIVNFSGNQIRKNVFNFNKNKIVDVDINNYLITFIKKSNELYISEDYGYTWENIILEDDVRLLNVKILQDQSILIILKIDNLHYSILTTDYGKSWDKSEISIEGTEFAIDFINNTIGYLVSTDINSNKILYKTNNKGKSWQKYNDFGFINANSLLDIKFINNENGFITTNNSSLLKTTNSGDDWIEESYDKNKKNILAQIHYDENSNLYICDSKSIYRKKHTITTVRNLKKISSIIIHPNPASDYIEISFSNKGLQPFANSGEIAIYDVLGECVLKSNSVASQTTHRVVSTTERIDISHLSQGIYFVKLGNSVNKFIISR